MLKIEKGTKSKWDQIILVLGESHSHFNMSLFGYQKPTTPFLQSQIKNPDFFHTVGLSGGVSTDISVAFLLNMGFGDAGSIKASKGQHCLFRLAKEEKFSTHFLSTQNSEQLRYIVPYLCNASLDDLRSLEDISPETLDHQAADDKELLRELSVLMKQDQKTFIILHQRGSHGPWERRSMVKNRIFPHNNRINHYDNSIYEFDLFMKKLSELLKNSSKKTLVLYVSDHGEALGQEGKWGHGQLLRTSFEVPVIMMSFNNRLPKEIKKIPKYVPHFNLALFLSKELGFKSNLEIHSLPKDYVIFGNDIDGFSGKAEILFDTNDTYNFKVIN